jgi:UDP:flavonoid glycosyltransferase YjiC (YdhE family)
MLGIENQLPLVVAGVHEGKNEINARIGYFELGINLKTERPGSKQIKNAVEEILNNTKYKENVTRLAAEFSNYNPGELTAHLITKILQKNGSVYIKNPEEERIY